MATASKRRKRKWPKRKKVWDGATVLRLRHKLKLTQVDLAAQIGVSFASVNRWENEQTKPSRLAEMRMEELDQ